MCFHEAYVLSNIWMHLIELNIVQMKNNIVNEHCDKNNKGYETDLCNVLVYSEPHRQC